jgi:hypothetical protein
LGREENPQKTFIFGLKTIQDIEPILSREGVLVHPEHRTSPTPKEFGQDALKEDVINVFR